MRKIIDSADSWNMPAGSGGCRYVPHRIDRRDGIGPEIIREGKKVLDAQKKFGFDIEWQDFDIGAERYLRQGDLLTEDDLQNSPVSMQSIRAIGDDRVKPGILEKGILLNLRFYFDQYINLRPIKLLKGVSTRLQGKDLKISICCRQGKYRRLLRRDRVTVYRETINSS